MRVQLLALLLCPLFLAADEKIKPAAEAAPAAKIVVDQEVNAKIIGVDELKAKLQEAAVRLEQAKAAVNQVKADPANPPAAGKRKLTASELRQFYHDPTDVIVTEWASSDQDHKVWRSFTNAGYATVLSEGKLEDGQMLFRKGFKHANDSYPDAEKPRWYTYNGITQRSFEETNAKLLKDNYTLMKMQRFLSDEGDFRYCGIWVKFEPKAATPAAKK